MSADRTSTVYLHAPVSVSQPEISYHKLTGLGFTYTCSKKTSNVNSSNKTYRLKNENRGLDVLLSVVLPDSSMLVTDSLSYWSPLSLTLSLPMLRLCILSNSFFCTSRGETSCSWVGQGRGSRQPREEEHLLLFSDPGRGRRGRRRRMEKGKRAVVGTHIPAILFFINYV